MKRFVLAYNIGITSLIGVIGIISASSLVDVAMGLAFVPVAIFFIRQLLLPSSENTNLPSISTRDIAQQPTSIQPAETQAEIIDPEVLTDAQVKDINRRLFFKLIGSAGLATFVFSMFTKRTHAAFFGSAPGPKAMEVVNREGDVIDPAEKEATDGYEINDVDDDDLPAYYGFVDIHGKWYITREDSSGGYRYVRGDSGYSSAWSARTTQSYDYFSSVF